MAIQKEIEIVAKTDKANKNIESVDKSIQDVDKSTKEVNSDLDKMSGGALSAFSNLRSGISKSITSFKNLRFAIAATGIGALVLGILAVKEAFTASEEGQNKFAKLMGVIGSVTGNLLDLLSDLGEKIIETFKNPRQALENFWQALKQNVVNRFVGLVEFIPKVGKVIQQLWDRDFAGASKTATDAIAKITLGIEDITDKTQDLIDKTKEYAKELEADAEAAGRIADKRAKADKIERDLIVQRAIADRKIAELREQAADKENFTAQERIEFLKEAGKINENITNQEIAAAKLRRDALIEENTLSKSNKEDLKAEEEAKARVIQLDTQRLNLQKRLTAEITSASREKTEETTEDKEAEEAAKAEQKRLEELQKVRDEYVKKQEDLDAETELEKIDLEEKRALAELDRLKATEEDKLKIIEFFNNKRLAITQNENKEEVASEEDLQKGKEQLINSSLSLLAEASKKSKVIQAGQAVANTWQGVTEVWSAKSVLPEPLATANKVVSTGVVLASGLNAVKNIGGSDSSSSSSTSQSTTAPSFNLVSGTSEDTINQSINGLNNRPIKTYVVSKEMTTEQEMDRNIKTSASI